MTRLSRQSKQWQAINWLLTGAICLGLAHTTLAQPGYKVTDANGDGNFAMQVALNPRLTPSETRQLLLDCDPVGAPQRIANWQLTNVYCGKHQLQVARLDARGAQLDASPASAVYVMRPIVNG